MISALSAPYSEELQLALRLARNAGDILKTFYEVPPVVGWKDGEEPVTEADKAANAYLVSEIGHAYSEDGILAEESVDDFSRLGKRRVWMIDPLDGTREYIAHVDEFCVMIGLVEDGRPVVGVVHLPVSGITYSAASGSGAFAEQFGDRYPVHVSSTSAVGEVRAAVSRSHPSPLVGSIFRSIGIQKERLAGSLGFKSGILAQGDVDFYLHPSAGPKEWDTAAPEVIIREAGGWLTDCWNRPLTYNQRDVRRRYGVMALNSGCSTELAQGVAVALDDLGVDPDFGFIGAAS